MQVERTDPAAAPIHCTPMIKFAGDLSLRILPQNALFKKCIKALHLLKAARHFSSDSTLVGLSPQLRGKLRKEMLEEPRKELADMKEVRNWRIKFDRIQNIHPRYKGR